MSFFDLIFPDWATASHLRTLTEQNRDQQLRNRIAANRANRVTQSIQRKTSERIEELEKELGQASLVIEALIEKLEEKGIASREEMQKLVMQIDTRDGVIDGRITPPEAQEFNSNRKWKDAQNPKFHFPEE